LHRKLKYIRKLKYLRKMETIRLTRELINRCKRVCNFTKATRIALGVSKKEVKIKGWTVRLEGKTITKEQYEKAIEGREIVLGKHGHGVCRIAPELNLVEKKRICERCGLNEVYLNIKTQTWCEPCLWRFLNSV
jgi:hypothetical protein